jgi:hypothetical protein
MNLRTLAPRVRWNEWLLALILLLPAAGLYAFHYLYPPEGSHPTGFIYADIAYYMANAREYADQGSFSLSYANPFDPSPGSPSIYFQPHIAFLALMLKAFPWDPGTIYLLFGLVAAAVCARVAVALYRDVVPGSGSPASLGLVLFFWGGGVLSIGGLAASALSGGSTASTFAQMVVRFDPFSGWWFLNFGRNLLFPNEAYTHILFFGTILLVRRKRFGPAALTAALTSISHPFTGAELLAVLVLWLGFELWRGDRAAIPIGFPAAITLILAFHALYYLIYLPGIPVHRSLMEQWKQPWIVPWTTTILAYLPVALLALAGLRDRSGPATPPGSPETRLLVAWFVAAFVLSHHELVIRPVQPLHFTRGYVWTPLFLLGAPVLVRWIGTRLAGRMWEKLAVASLCALFFFDNAAWFTAKMQERETLGIAVSSDAAEVLSWIGSVGDNRTLLISADEEIEYLSAVYTPVRPWRGHEFNTPESIARDYLRKRFFTTGAWFEEWHRRKVIVVQKKNARRVDLSGERTLARFENGGYDAFLAVPAD